MPSRSLWWWYPALRPHQDSSLSGLNHHPRFTSRLTRSTSTPSSPMRRAIRLPISPPTISRCSKTTGAGNASFAHFNIPVTRAEQPLYARPTNEANVQRNDGAVGRLYVIAFDDVQPVLALRTRIFLRRFIEERFGDNDRAAVVSLAPIQSSRNRSDLPATGGCC